EDTPLARPRLGRALAVGDLDNDGRLDAVVLDHTGPLALLRNRTEPSGRWVVLGLEGTESNRDAIGARVTLRAGGRTFVAHRIGGGSYQSSGDPRLHFGLGAADRIDEIEIRWPSGRIDRHADLPVDVGLHVR